MASRRQIKDAFYDELVDAASGSHTVTYDDGTTETLTVPDSRVTTFAPDVLEQLPAVAYSDSYITREVNGVGNGPDEVTYDSEGIIQAELYREYVTGIFEIYLASYSGVKLEPLYEAVRRAFGKYNVSAERTSVFHSDVEYIELTDTSDNDFISEETAIRSDVLTVEIDFHRDYETIDDVIESVDQTTLIDDNEFDNLLTE